MPVIPAGTVLPRVTTLSAARPSNRPTAPKGARSSRRASARLYGGRFRQINTFVDAAARGLPPTVALVWVVLWRDVNNGVATTSQSRIASRLGIGRATVDRALRRLRSDGLVELVARGGRTAGPSIFRLKATHGAE
jgi:hypothetical protein